MTIELDIPRDRISEDVSDKAQEQVPDDFTPVPPEPENDTYGAPPTAMRGRTFFDSQRRAEYRTSPLGSHRILKKQAIRDMRAGMPNPDIDYYNTFTAAERRQIVLQGGAPHLGAVGELPLDDAADRVELSKRLLDIMPGAIRGFSRNPPRWSREVVEHALRVDPSLAVGRETPSVVSRLRVVPPAPLTPSLDVSRLSATEQSSMNGALERAQRHVEVPLFSGIHFAPEVLAEPGMQTVRDTLALWEKRTAGGLSARDDYRQLVALGDNVSLAQLRAHNADLARGEEARHALLFADALRLAQSGARAHWLRPYAYFSEAERSQIIWSAIQHGQSLYWLYSFHGSGVDLFALHTSMLLREGAISPRAYPLSKNLAKNLPPDQVAELALIQRMTAARTRTELIAAAEAAAAAHPETIDGAWLPALCNSVTQVPVMRRLLVWAVERQQQKKPAAPTTEVLLEQVSGLRGFRKDIKYDPTALGLVAGYLADLQDRCQDPFFARARFARTFFSDPELTELISFLSRVHENVSLSGTHDGIRRKLVPPYTREVNPENAAHLGEALDAQSKEVICKMLGLSAERYAHWRRTMPAWVAMRMRNAANARSLIGQIVGVPATYEPPSVEDIVRHALYAATQPDGYQADYALSETFGVPLTTLWPLHSPDNVGQLLGAVEKVSAAHPSVFPSAWVDMLKARPVNALTMRTLMGHALALSQDGEAVPADSLDLVSRRASLQGLELSRRDHYSDKAVDFLMSYVLDLQATMTEPFFAGVHFAPEVTQARTLTQLNRVVGTMRDLVALGAEPQPLRAALRHASERGAISVVEADRLAEDLEQQVLQRLRRLSPSLSGGNLARLRERWGDLSPIYTLLARYQGARDWRVEIPEVMAIFDAVLKNDFTELKFRGARGNAKDRERAQRQTAPLTGDALEGWIADDLVASMWDPKSAVLPPEKMTAMAHRHILANVQPHLAQDGARPEFDTLIAQMLAENTPKEIMRLAKVLDAAIRAHPPQNGDLRNQLVADVRQLRALVAPVEVAKNAKPVPMVTVFTSDPLMLLMIGEVVDAASCQHYATGFLIQTLPSYVKDANIKAMVTFMPQASMYKRIHDYEAVCRSITRGHPTMSFDAAKRILTIDGVQSEPLGKGMLRHMIKLGTTHDALAGLAPEQAYAQSHPALLAMEQQQRLFLEAIARKTGAVLDQDITVAATGNPKGSYSDAAGGAQTDDYVIRAANRAEH